MNKRQLAEKLVAAIVPYLERNGVPDISPHIASAKALRANLCGVEIIYLQRAAALTKTPPPRLVDIWIEGGNKVFSAWFSPLDVVSFKRGQWVDDLLASLAAENGNCPLSRSAA